MRFTITIATTLSLALTACQPRSRQTVLTECDPNKPGQANCKKTSRQAIYSPSDTPAPAPAPVRTGSPVDPSNGPRPGPSTQVTVPPVPPRPTPTESPAPSPSATPTATASSTPSLEPDVAVEFTAPSEKPQLLVGVSGEAGSNATEVTVVLSTRERTITELAFNTTSERHELKTLQIPLVVQFKYKGKTCSANITTNGYGKKSVKATCI